ncbi:MAG: hypothetical protein C5B51_17460 [Terriglobia bacterium]|nr:MAG: hypothetical protein C5B51_17460 [Terriglobia bacterium]
MDLAKTLGELYAQREQLERTIAILEELQTGAPARRTPLRPYRRRGRRFMPAEERQAVSERMKKYWAKRRSPDGRRLGTDGNKRGS